jgi:RPA family protein
MVERQVSKNVRIYDLVSGVFIPGDRETMTPNVIVTPLGDRVSRAKIVGTVTENFRSEDGRFGSLTVDDGTGAIRVRVFQNDLHLIEMFRPGDLVSVVGKVKNFHDENYLLPDMVSLLPDPNSELLFRLETLNDIMDKKRAADDIVRLRNQMSEEELVEYASQKYEMDRVAVDAVLRSRAESVDYRPAILDAILKLDSGEGVEIAKILEVANLDESMAEAVISELLDSGEIYEPVAGRLKRV